MGIWDQLNTKKLGDRPGTDLDQQTKDIHIQETNRSSLEDTNLINQASMRDGRPIPGTQKVHEGPTVTDNTRTIAFTPEPGEVWSVMNITCHFTNHSGTSGVYLYVYDTANAILQSFFYGSSSSTDFMLDDDGTWDDFVISYPCQIQFVIGDATNWDDATLQMNMIRLR